MELHTSIECEMCECGDNLVFCEGCGLYYCDECWGKLKSHRNQGQGVGGIPHSKTKPEIVQAIKASMSEPTDEHEEVHQHVKDSDTVWFGLSQDEGGEPALADYRRYASIIMERAPDTTSVRHPGLVSFIGPTGSGKSTLIKLLIDPTTCAEGDEDVAVPVIGRGDCETPTSADVHLYIDPATTSGTRPILFADCEGFEGGERDPIAQQTTSGGFLSSRTSSMSLENAAGPAKRMTLAVTKRVLRWASRNSQHSEQTSKRQYAVTEMYPRIFHAFSDVIVFVLNNPKTMEDVVEKLLKWADANHSTSINMPCKPHAIIAINKSHNSASNEYWLPAQTTEDFFNSMSDQINKNPTFLRYAEKWRKSNIPVHDMQELFERYYWTIHVVRLPEKSRYDLMYQQREALRSVIAACCQRSLSKRKSVSILPDVDEFGMYLSLAFDHFSMTLDKPFDYVKASLQFRPPPETLEDNLLEFVLLIAEALNIEGDIGNVFGTITKMVASYFMLDSVRKQRMGQPQDWFGAKFFDMRSSTIVRKSASSYRGICHAVVSKYFHQHVPCQFEVKPNKLLLQSGFKCELVKATHGEGCHRMRGGLGSREYFGSFEHDFKLETFAWNKKILDEFQPLHGDHMGASPSDASSRQRAVSGHGRQLEHFFSRYRLFSNRICLGCLFNAPTFRLRCGHVICMECALDFGEPVGGARILIERCPLHNTQQAETSKSSASDVIQLDPVDTGLRVLVLDGGGVRGIVELCVLEAIEELLRIPVQSFFDLVVGTSTGGIISLGLGHELWPISHCIEKFRALVSSAFQLRPTQNVEGLKYLERLIKHSKYKTRLFEETLRRVFSDSPLFAPRNDTIEFSDKQGGDAPTAGRPRLMRQPLKVAVAAVSEAGKTAYLLANYNVGTHHAPQEGSTKKTLRYVRARPNKDDHELRPWEAARATSAAPGFFKPFQSGRFKPPIQFMDGAIQHNNPIQVAIEEARRLSAERSLSPQPDIVLSVGTGLPRDGQVPEISERMASKPLARAQEFMRHQRKLPFMQMLFTMVGYQVKLNIDCERRYEQVARELQRDRDWAGRLHRINPDLGEEPPLLDAVEKVEPLLQNVRGRVNYKEAPEKREIHAVACKLVASSFYFERRGNAAKGDGSSVHVRGTIRCRLHETAEIRALGNFLSSCYKTPNFVVINYIDHDENVEIPISAMQEDGRFDGVELDISVAGEDAVTSIELKMEREVLQDLRLFRLSGFPRKLVKEDSRGPRRW